MRPQRLVIIGAGGRGRDAYGRWALDHPDRARIVGVADLSAIRRGALAAEAGGAAEYEDWQDAVADLGRLRADGVVIAVPDALHVDVAIAVADAGLPFLLEKPAAPDLAELTRLAAHVRQASSRLAVGHVLRFTPFWRSVKRILDSGAIGRAMTLEVRENVGFWHFAHSYVRGNWRRSASSGAMVLTKTSHDLDLIRWLAGDAPDRVYSIGELTWFRPENAPPGAPGFCLDGCPVADSCPFFAPRYYVDALAGVSGHPVHLLGGDPSPEGRLAALRTGDYGRCVYRSDNDVADHQQTTMMFPGGLTATLTASAFTAENTRNVVITASAGQLTGHMESGEIVVDLFSPSATLPDGLPVAEHEVTRKPPMGHERHTLRVRPPEDDLGDHAGHAGGDAGLMSAFVDALVSATVGEGELSFDTALDSHLIAFAAEHSRVSGHPIDFASWVSQLDIAPTADAGRGAGA
ncbi:Gfo/Idh/MocA family protein [Agromyces aerolatus]|uniref:Gfo/Idh/MocA family protein n=1 Tax=Agromyces sp. LY-1074 TaxID=3074080 RepID=UPI002858068F|nr:MULTISPECIES: Gfo/Idh/MocA family oxidoreductase [unclassified Agromyces]MDR5699236.1 Gfo/Idh/MocA family oxidoreductase [Agromyces sp. LY-1074]MDR5705532.1 Gfo/Idh/MocA family oxidoreductase [Agromyces sp. LY-1358]